MSKLSQRKSRLLLETAASENGRPLIVEIKAHGVLIREKGRRRPYQVPWLAIYWQGAKAAAEERRRKR